MHKQLYSQKRLKSNSNCPECGFHISYHRSFETVLAGDFENEDNGGYTAFRSTPLRQSTLESDFLVPIAQSLVWAIVSVLPAIPVAMWLRYEWYFTFAVGTMSLLASWYRSMKRSEASLCTVEEFTYTPSEGLPSPDPGCLEKSHLKLDITDRSNPSQANIKFIDLPPSVSEKKFLEFCRGVVSGKSISRKLWTPERILFSRDQYDVLVSKLSECGIIGGREGGGKTLTAGGRRAVARYVGEVGNGASLV